jgi:N-acetylmuramoyl-L-alanine amidase
VAEGPYRLVVDIDGLELSAQLKDLVGKVRPDDPYIAGVRVGQYQPRVVRLVLDLKQPVAPQQFTLAPVAAYQHRLVFDLYPQTGGRPAAGDCCATRKRRTAGRTRGAGRAGRADRAGRPPRCGVGPPVRHAPHSASAPFPAPPAASAPVLSTPAPREPAPADRRRTAQASTG